MGCSVPTNQLHLPDGMLSTLLPCLCMPAGLLRSRGPNSVLRACTPLCHPQSQLHKSSLKVCFISLPHKPPSHVTLISHTCIPLCHPQSQLHKSPASGALHACVSACGRLYHCFVPHCNTSNVQICQSGTAHAALLASHLAYGHFCHCFVRHCNTSNVQICQSNTAHAVLHASHLACGHLNQRFVPHSSTSDVQMRKSGVGHVASSTSGAS
eukprot:1138838-Pelagomonas_calceolata.AAC.8